MSSLANQALVASSGQSPTNSIMKLRLLLAILSLAVISVPLAATPADGEKAILQAEREWCAAYIHSDVQASPEF